HLFEALLYRLRRGLCSVLFWRQQRIPHGRRTEHQHLPLAVHTPRAQTLKEALPEQQGARDLTNACRHICDTAMANSEATDSKSKACDFCPVCESRRCTREKIIRVLDRPSTEQGQRHISWDIDF